MTNIREARGEDVDAIRAIFTESYGEDYPHPEYYDPESLKRMVYADDTLLLVAEDEETGTVQGTASVVLEVGAHADFIGEFGRLAVHPDARHQGIGSRLMEERIERVRERLHLALVEPRAVHSYSQKIEQKFGFVPVGFLPMKHRFHGRESVVLFAQYYGDTLEHRRNHPRVIPEAYPLADLTLRGCGVGPDAIVDAGAPPYPPISSFELETFTSEAYTALLHIERGRVEQREILGPMRLHYGLFKLRTSRATYLTARRNGRLAGAVGVILDPNEQSARVFELISPDDESVRFLLEKVTERCDREWAVEYLEVDVNAHAPRMQRTLLELGFRPCAYIPAMAFDRVERLDVVRLVRLGVPLDLGDIDLIDPVIPFADSALDGFRGTHGRPEIAEAVHRARLFDGMTDEQVERLAEAMHLREIEAGEEIVSEGGTDQTAALLLERSAEVHMDGARVGRVEAGEILGELALLTGESHRATARATERIRVAVLTHEALTVLVRTRPDIAMVLYRNLALDLRERLDRVGRSKRPAPAQIADEPDAEPDP